MLDQLFYLFWRQPARRGNQAPNLLCGGVWTFPGGDFFGRETSDHEQVSQRHLQCGGNVLEQLDFRRDSTAHQLIDGGFRASGGSAQDATSQATVFHQAAQYGGKVGAHSNKLLRRVGHRPLAGRR